MLIEVLLGGAVWAGAEAMKRGVTDKQKLDRIFRKCGLYVKYNGKEETPKFIRSNQKESYTEYVYRIPEGLGFKDFEKKREIIEDSLNSSNNNITLSDVKKFDIKGDYKKQINEIKKSKIQQKEIVMTYNKLLTVKVFNQPLTDYLPYENTCGGWNVPIGVTRTEFIKHDFEKIMHMVVAGTTRYGKSIFLKNVITTLLLNQPKNVSFTLIDLKGGLTFNRFSQCPQIQNNTSEPEESLEVLQIINSQMDEVMEYLKQNNYENVQEAKIPNRHYIIIDEGAELAPGIEKDKDLKAIKNDCEVILSRIARIGGALGYRLIYATQTPYSEVLNHNIKQNCDAKLCFKLQTDKASEVVLGEGITDAHHLPFIKGRGVYLTDRKHIVQTPMIENDYIEGVVKGV
ncbi:FtsK/SpoIIIE domain-containing protein [Evansella cellulosilytica]|uniref:Cell division protein FtsK/SpoIIIE n=1 Tax=Evansella cellulosilytica (strain ATCC 21833 / DSM 2522 / FERM P-1141 / JCM 9156 / N-4) TaxID=649639 RepID=E6U1M2_EVAC2|nr:FtsK/SpoIIIE domain-containing protein [Evansella cellulosilytica]ADU30385.1 cell division protein FtsK/SpoIIIE [Evansella cellulosilytica DSM 2522]